MKATHCFELRIRYLFKKTHADQLQKIDQEQNITTGLQKAFNSCLTCLSFSIVS